MYPQLLSKDKYVAEILKKFDFASVKTASTPIETQKPLVKDEEASDVDVHLYRSMIGSLMYVTASRPDIMFAVCACSRFQVTPKTSHLSAVKRIFRYLKGKPKLGLWYPRESSFDLESYSDSDYAGANLDRKSTTGGCQFLGRRLITWQCKKQTIVATSTTEAEYVAAASCCGQVLWIQNQMLDYGFNFMNTKIYIDNESTICIVKNPVYHSKTKHIAIRHHFIRDAYEKKLIQVLKIHTNDNVADLLTKAFDIKGKNSLVKHFEDMRLCRPSKEYFQMGLRRSRESLRRVTDGAEAFLILTLFLLSLEKVTKTYKNPSQSHTYSSNLSNLHSSLQALISLTDDLSFLSNMAALESCPKHNMIAYLEKTEGNVEFHEVIDFLRRSSIFHALTLASLFSISEASIRTDLIFDDADGIDSLPNQAIFDAIQRMGYEGDLTVVTNNKPLDVGAFPQKRLSDEQPSPSPAPTSEVPYEPHTDSSPAHTSEVPIEQQPEPSPRPSPTPTIPDSIPEPTGETLYKDPQKELRKENIGSHKESYNIDHMETDNAQSEGRTREMVDEDKELDEDRLSTEDAVSTDKEGVSTDFEKVSTDFEKVSTDKPIVSTDGSKVSTDEQIEGADDQVEGTEEHNESIEEIFESTEEQRPGTEEKVESTAGQIEATLLLNMSKAKAVSKEKEKGVELKDVEEIDRPRPTSTRSLLTLKPLPKIDPKDKGKKKIEEEDESEIQEEWEAEEEENRIAKEKATSEALIKNFDDIKARMSNRILAEKLQEQEREQFTIEERAKFLHDTIAAQRKFLAQQRSEAIRNRPPTKNQLRNQMMTYLKHVGNFKHSELKSKKFEDIQAMYEKIKRSDEDFIAIRSVEDESLIKKMKNKDSSKGEEIKQESKEEVKEEDKDEENTRKRKQAPDEDKEVDYEILDKKYPIIDWKTENLGTKPQFDESKRSEEINMNVVTRSNGQKRSFSTLMRVLLVFDREDLDAVYKLVMDIYQDKIPEGFDKVLWGDLIVMFNPDEQDEF
ncbi:hypothetical protein Tco_0971829 [Tanacetum coccineum]